MVQERGQTRDPQISAYGFVAGDPHLVWPDTCTTYMIFCVPAGRLEVPRRSDGETRTMLSNSHKKSVDRTLPQALLCIHHGSGWEGFIGPRARCRRFCNSSIEKFKDIHFLLFTIEQFRLRDHSRLIPPAGAPCGSQYAFACSLSSLKCCRTECPCWVLPHLVMPRAMATSSAPSGLSEGQARPQQVQQILCCRALSPSPSSLSLALALSVRV